MKYIIEWRAEDVQTLQPDWTMDECENWLQMNWKYMRDRSIEHGWEVLETLLPPKGEKP